MRKVVIDGWVKAHPVFYRLARKMVACSLHLCRKQRDQSIRRKLEWLQEKEIFERNLLPDELRAFRVAELKGWRWRRYEFKEENRSGFITTYWIAEFAQDRDWLWPKRLFAMKGFEPDAASRSLLEVATPELSHKSLVELDLLLAIHKGE